MGDEQEKKDFAAAFDAKLKELTKNSKPIITCLTMIADESRNHQATIVKLISARIESIPDAGKRIPVIYVMDSIIKNVPEYNKAFAPQAQRLFLDTWEKAKSNAKLRQSLAKLLKTWRKQQVFDPRLLDRIEAMDPALQAAVTEGTKKVFVNPKFRDVKRPREEQPNGEAPVRRRRTDQSPPHASGVTPARPPVGAVPRFSRGDRDR